MELLEKVTPILEGTRDILMKVSEMIAGAFDLSINNTYLLVLFLFSFLLGKWIFNFFYTDTKGRTSYLVLIVGLIFAALKYL